jgi:NADH dehydrogenase [ubiquinone] 1 alpha subcomplex assembly factor 2
VRQQNLKVLAAQADAKWAAKPSFLDAPARQRELPVGALEAKNPRSHSESTEPENQTGLRSVVGDGLSGRVREAKTTAEKAISKEQYQGEMEVPDALRHRLNERPSQENSPKAKQKPQNVKDLSKHARGGPSEKWQPKGWDGTIEAPRH